MIKPITATPIPNNQAVLNLMFCSAPTVYEKTAKYTPAGQKLNLECCGGKGRRHLGNKLNVLA